MSIFTIGDTDGKARTGVLTTAHAKVQTPAFIPLASKATVKSMLAEEVRSLGFEMVLGNAYHLFLSPGHDQIENHGGLHKFMGWDGALITDSGGFQVFSMGHGRVADEIKGRERASVGEERKAEVVSIEEEGVTFRSYLDGSARFIGPETSMQVQAALASDIALAFDECTPFHAGREYTARSMERTHRWLDRCVEWQRQNGPKDQALFGIVQGGVYRDLRDISTERVSESPVSGVAIGGSLGQEKEQIYEVVGWVTSKLPDRLPRHLLGIGEVDDLLAAVSLGIDLFDCAMPTRLARHGMALVAAPGSRWRIDLKKSAARDQDAPIAEGCDCLACRKYTRAYLHYLMRAGEITGIRLVTTHNLHFMAKLMEGIRSSISHGCFGSFKQEIMAGTEPWGVDLSG